MGSDSVTCHLTEVILTPSPQCMSLLCVCDEAVHLAQVVKPSETTCVCSIVLCQEVVVICSSRQLSHVEYVWRSHHHASQ